MTILRVFSGRFALLYYLLITIFNKQKCHMSTSANTSKNRKLFDEVRDIMDGDEYLNIEVGLFTSGCSSSPL
jgi:hypothetical protein